MTYGLDADGFTLKRYEDIKTDTDNGSKAIFGETLDLDPRTPNGQFNALLCTALTLIWEQMQNTYDALNPQNATGDSLSSLVQLNNVTRKTATYTTVSAVTLSGSSGTFIPAGSIVSTDDDVQFGTDTDVTIPAGGSDSVDVTALATGRYVITAGTIVNIDTPIAGWSGVTNPNPGVAGNAEETDSELRTRRGRSIEKTATNSVESLAGELLDIPEVIDVLIQSNRTAVVDAAGLDPHSIKVLVDGGADATIAETIFNGTPLDTGFNGDESENVVDSMGVTHEILFDRPDLITIYVEVTLKEGSLYIDDDLVKSTIVDFASGDLLEGQGFPLGSDVIYSEMYIPLNQTSLGIEEITSLKIDTVSPPTGTDTISIEYYEKAYFDPANITIVKV